MNESPLIPLNHARLRSARIKQGLTIEEASRLASINKMTLLRYESGDIRTISPERLCRLAGVCGTSPAWLAGLSPEEEFLTDKDQILLSPDSAQLPSHLGPRLLACLHFLSESE